MALPTRLYISTVSALAASRISPLLCVCALMDIMYPITPSWDNRQHGQGHEAPLHTARLVRLPHNADGLDKKYIATHRDREAMLSNGDFQATQRRRSKAPQVQDATSGDAKNQGHRR
jgi:hypothetical protein